MKVSYKLLLFLTFALFLLHLNFLYVDIMEARNFVTAREMTDEGNWIFTTMNGEPRYQKPPLPTWLSALMGEIFGTESVWALRFPAALSCSALILFFYKFLRRETGDKKLAVISGLILCTTFLVLFVGKRATWDIFCYSFTFMGIYYFYLTIRSEKNNFLRFTLAGFFLGCSIMSKGPTGFYVLAVPFFVAYCITYGFPKIKWGGWLWMVCIVAIVGLWWYGYIYFYDKETFLSIMETESNARTNREVKPFTRYFSFPIQMGVWSIFALVSLFFPYIKKKTLHFRSYKFLFWWTVICFVLLSLIPSKKERYLFPLMIPLAATTGFYIQYLIENRSWKVWEKNLIRFSFGLTGVLAVAVPVLLFLFFKVEASFYSIAFSVISVVIGIYLLIETFRNFNLHHAFLGTVAFVSAAMLLGIPVIDLIFNNNPNYKSILTEKDKIENSGMKLYGLNAYSPEIWFKYGKIIPEIYPERIETYPKEKEFLLISIKNTDPETFMNELGDMGYKAELLNEFDDNEEKPGTKNNVDRKRMMLFKVRSKN